MASYVVATAHYARPLGAYVFLCMRAASGASSVEMKLSSIFCAKSSRESSATIAVVSSCSTHLHLAIKIMLKIFCMRPERVQTKAKCNKLYFSVKRGLGIFATYFVNEKCMSAWRKSSAKAEIGEPGERPKRVRAHAPHIA